MRQASPEQRPAAAPDEILPVLDSSAVRRNYRLARLKRRERLERDRRSAHATVRFWAIVVLLLSLSTYLGLTIWHEVQRLFGL
jgi:hypothetical protein